MIKRTQDEMTYVQNYGQPDLFFLSLTCNPAWHEIDNELFLGQKPHNRHDLLARVFHRKLKNFYEPHHQGKDFWNCTMLYVHHRMAETRTTLCTYSGMASRNLTCARRG
ncbi:helitron_like_N domain-containing protein [Trichonephila inaurata madagascariensis]|uniref:Helitron_like_N domain-containing protein n=1 Tax=Trichonephila inaurata madagascariensis TaxID=2747483 RepID=A0A8X6XM84_9ARAC|nr:helitron_like_N domain-containing protein [Trichonephila inaurata madagascariensis]GFY55738.1 helitron_like_N domain-containing protein [Trichonephila inaurata madagascariensis]